MKKLTKIFLMLLVVISFATTSCKKEFESKQPVVTDNHSDASFSLKFGQTKYNDGDSLWCVPGIQNLFYIYSPTPGCYYDWNFCGTNFPGSPTNLQTNMAYMFPTTTTCVVTITEQPSGNFITVTVFASNTNPLVPPLYFEGSSQNLDGTYAYDWGVRKDRISDLVGAIFQIGDHTTWLQSFTNISTTPGDSLIHFTFSTYNMMAKFNAGRGTTFSDVTGSIWASLQWPADNNYQSYFEDGVPHPPSYSPTIVSPGLIGDNAGPFRATVDSVNIHLFFQISNFVSGLKTSPYFNYRINSGPWSGNTPLTWTNGYGWAQSPVVPVSLIPPGAIISVVYGATGGQAAMGSSSFYVPSAAAIQFQINNIQKLNGQQGFTISKVSPFGSSIK